MYCQSNDCETMCVLRLVAEFRFFLLVIHCIKNPHCDVRFSLSVQTKWFIRQVVAKEAFVFHIYFPKNCCFFLSIKTMDPFVHCIRVVRSFVHLIRISIKKIYQIHYLIVCKRKTVRKKIFFYCFYFNYSFWQVHHQHVNDMNDYRPPMFYKMDSIQQTLKSLTHQTSRQQWQSRSYCVSITFHLFFCFDIFTCLCLLSNGCHNIVVMMCRFHN